MRAQLSRDPAHHANHFRHGRLQRRLPAGPSDHAGLPRRFTIPDGVLSRDVITVEGKAHRDPAAEARVGLATQ
jgi:hypothetical protein